MEKWVRTAAAFVFWPIEMVRKAIGWKYRANRLIVHHSRFYRRTLSVKPEFLSDHSSLSPNLLKRNPKAVWYKPWTWYQKSDAQWLHDVAYQFGRWDDGMPMMWRQANDVMLDVLDVEGHPECVIDVYEMGITSKRARAVWDEYRRRDQARMILEGS